MRNERFLLLLPVAVALGGFGLFNSAACGGSSSSSSGAGDCFDYTGFDSTSPVSFFSDVLPIFQNSCGLSSSCHGSPTPPVPGQHFYGPSNATKVSMGDPVIAMILAGAVGQKSVDEPDMDIIAAGDPAHSFMMYKLDADPQTFGSVNCSKLTCAASMTCLNAMPQAGNTLPAAQRDTIRRWIAQGAKNN